MLTSRDAVEDVVRGLDAGADDYLAKPFRFDELLARIRALHRRGGAERLEVLRYGPVTLDRLRHVATVNDKPLDLTPKEFQLLEYFLLHPEEVVRRTTLLEKVWDMHFDPESNVVDVHVGNLRRKLTRGGRASRSSPRCAASASACAGARTRRSRRPADLRRGAALPARRRAALHPRRAWSSAPTVSPERGHRRLDGRARPHRPAGRLAHAARRSPRAASPPISSRCSPSSPRCSSASRWPA